jgi:hypothetical protein
MNPVGKFIQGIELSFVHIGTLVTFIPLNEEKPFTGKIKSWNDNEVLVDIGREIRRKNFNDLIFE